ncbi:MAG: phage portal protein, partial [Acidobacteriota bacterium]|nr:phage portal protein [Acidobacteriota bacterium]
SAVDRLVETLSPQLGIKRQVARRALAMLADDPFDAGRGKNRRRSRRRRQKATPQPPDRNNRDLPTLRALCRHLAHNDPVAASATNTMITKLLGAGLVVRPAPRPQHLPLSESRLQEFVERTNLGFSQIWGSACDLEQETDWLDYQALVARSVFDSGDNLQIFTNANPGPFKLALQGIEADRICNPQLKPDGALTNGNRLSAGVEKDEQSRIQQFHVCRGFPGDYRDKDSKDWFEVPRWSRPGVPASLLIYRRTRPGQTRGLPMLTPVLDALEDLTQYRRNELQAALVASLFSVIVSPKVADGLEQAGNTDPTARPGGTDDEEKPEGLGKDIELGPGAVLEADNPADVQTVNPGRPSSVFAPFTDYCLRILGAGIGMGSEILLKHFSTSYTAARAALNELFELILKDRAWYVRVFCRWVYWQWMDEAVATNFLYAPGYLTNPLLRAEYRRASWVGPSRSMVDPLKEVLAAIKRIQARLSNHHIEAQGLGHDWDELMRVYQTELGVIEEAFAPYGEDGLVEAMLTTKAQAEPSALVAQLVGGN